MRDFKNDLPASNPIVKQRPGTLLQSAPPPYPATTNMVPRAPVLLQPILDNTSPNSRAEVQSIMVVINKLEQKTKVYANISFEPPCHLLDYKV